MIIALFDPSRPSLCRSIAESTRGHRYIFSIHNGEPVAVFREIGRTRDLNGRTTGLRQVSPPRALIDALKRKHVRSQN